MCAFARIFLALSLWLTFIGQAPASVLDSIIEQIPTAPLIRGQYTQTQKLVHVPQPFVTHGHFVFWRDSVFLWKTAIPTHLLFPWRRQNSAFVHATARAPGPMWQLMLKESGAMTISPVLGNAACSSSFSSSAASSLSV